MIKKILTTSVIFLFGIASYASATPSLGFQPIEDFNASYEEYLGHTLPYDGSSGIEMTAWFGRNDGPLAGEDLAADIWLVTNSLMGDDFTYGTLEFDALYVNPDKKIISYHDLVGDPDHKVTYFGINLGNVEGSDWYQAPSFSSGDFRFNTDTLTYSNLAVGEWLFALADFGDAGFYQTGMDEFSPPTSSSTPIPEPATMLLFGTGLVGLAGYARKRTKK